MKKETFNIADLIFKSLLDNLKESESERLMEWRNRSAANEESYQRILSKNSFAKQKSIYKSLESLKDYAEIAAQIRRGKRQRRFRNVRTASVAVILLVLGALVFFQKIPFFHQEELAQSFAKITPGKASAVLKTALGETIHLGGADTNVITGEEGVTVRSKGNSLSYEKNKEGKVTAVSEKYNTLSVPRGGEYQLKLADGTLVWLNSESSIKYPVQFLKKKREVYVSGEVYFEVAHDTSSPFVVNTAKTQIQVLGTAFNLRAYEDENYVQATLVNGKITAQSGESVQVLSPSEQYTYNKDLATSTVKSVDVNMYTSWKDGVFLFDSKRLDYILNAIARWYDVDFTFQDEILKSYVFSGRLRKYENANSLLEIFEDTGNIAFVEREGKIYIMKKK